jgi:hypothetical protein
VDAEIRGSNRVLSRAGVQAFSAEGVSGVESPERFSRYVTTQGWKPIDLSVRVTDVAAVISKFGGAVLYGENLEAPLRELIANSADAVRARRHCLHGGFGESDGCVTVAVGCDGDRWWLEVRDDGIGMSEDVVRGPLLDFGVTYWSSSLSRREFPGLLSGGFRPSGKFGIGFFSVFMLGARVRVVSRRFTEAVESTLVLEMDRDLKHPVLRRADPHLEEESVPMGGTRVRVWLERSPLSDGGVFDIGKNYAFLSGLLKSEGLDAKTKLKDVPEALVRKHAERNAVRVLARIAPALDVHLKFALDGERTPVTAVLPRDWETLPFADLLARLSGAYGSDRSDLDPSVSTFVCEPRRGGVLLGRFCVSEDRYLHSANLRVLAIGGMAADCEIQHVSGVLVGENPRLDRSGGVPRISAEEIGAQFSLAVEAGFSKVQPGGNVNLAGFLLRHGVVPKGLQCFYVNGEITDLRGLGVWARERAPDSTVCIADDDDFLYENELGEESQPSLRYHFDAVSLEVDLVVAPNESPMRSSRRLGVIFSPPDSDGEHQTLADLAIAEIRRAWRLDPDAVAAEAERVRVGYHELRDGAEQDIVLQVYRLERPARPNTRKKKS